MNGATGVLSLKIDDSGRIVSQSCQGDKRVCGAALRAVTMIGTLPKPPSPECRDINVKLTPKV